MIWVKIISFLVEKSDLHAVVQYCSKTDVHCLRYSKLRSVYVELDVECTYCTVVSESESETNVEHVMSPESLFKSSASSFKASSRLAPQRTTRSMSRPENQDYEMANLIGLFPRLSIKFSPRKIS